MREVHASVSRSDEGGLFIALDIYVDRIGDPSDGHLYAGVAKIDTGFDGFLALPLHLKPEGIDHDRVRKILVKTGDGVENEHSVYNLLFRTTDDAIAVEVDTVFTGPFLVGMEFLEGSQMIGTLSEGKELRLRWA